MFGQAQEQNKIGLVRPCGVRGGGGYIGPMDYIKPVVNYRFELFEGPSLKVNFLSSP